MSYPYLTRNITLVTSTNAYASGDVIGSGINAVNNVPSGMFLQGITITSKSCNTGQMDFLPFRSSMPNTTFTDNSAIAVSTQDSTSALSPIHVSDWTSLGTPYVGTANGLGYVYRVANANLPVIYFALVTRGTPTFGSSNDVEVHLTFVS